eukprot:scaffold20479_cov68-Phaeocystis_antarctica.AAC.5
MRGLLALLVGSASAFRLPQLRTPHSVVLRCGAPVLAVGAGIDLEEAIQQTIAADTVVIYSKSWCPYCAQCKALFDDMSLPYTVVELDQREVSATRWHRHCSLPSPPLTLAAAATAGWRATAGHAARDDPAADGAQRLCLRAAHWRQRRHAAGRPQWEACGAPRHHGRQHGTPELRCYRRPASGRRDGQNDHRNGGECAKDGRCGCRARDSCHLCDLWLALRDALCGHLRRDQHLQNRRRVSMRLHCGLALECRWSALHVRDSGRVRRFRQSQAAAARYQCPLVGCGRRSSRERRRPLCWGRLSGGAQRDGPGGRAAHRHHRHRLSRRWRCGRCEAVSLDLCLYLLAAVAHDGGAQNDWKGSA